MLFVDTQFVLLAEGWSDLIGIIVIFGFYLIGVVTKMAAKRSGSEGNDDKSETSYVVELAKKRAKERQMQQQAITRQKALSDWDRRQEAKRRRQTQTPERIKQTPQPVPKRPVYQERPKKPSIQVKKDPQYVNALNDQIQQTYINIQHPKVSSKQRRKFVPALKPKMPSQSVLNTPPPTSPNPLGILLNHPDELRKAIILKEILDKPVALREELWNF